MADHKRLSFKAVILPFYLLSLIYTTAYILQVPAVHNYLTLLPYCIFRFKRSRNSVISYTVNPIVPTKPNPILARKMPHSVKPVSGSINSAASTISTQFDVVCSRISSYPLALSVPARRTSSSSRLNGGLFITQFY